MPAKKPAKAINNLTLEDARAAVLKALATGRKTRNQLKAVAPFGSYTALMGGLETDGLLTKVVRKPDLVEGDASQQYELNAKGKKGGK